MAKKSASLKTNNSVMIIDDDLLIGRLLTHWLMQRGFDVEIAKNGRQALECLEKCDPPRLILLDIMMPFADGFEVLAEIRARKEWKKVPIIMLTSKSNETSVVRAFEAGADDYVTKPFKPAELMVRMNRLLK